MKKKRLPNIKKIKTALDYKHAGRKFSERFKENTVLLPFLVRWILEEAVGQKERRGSREGRERRDGGWGEAVKWERGVRRPKTKTKTTNTWEAGREEKTITREQTQDPRRVMKNILNSFWREKESCS